MLHDNQTKQMPIQEGGYKPTKKEKKAEEPSMKWAALQAIYNPLLIHEYKRPRQRSVWEAAFSRTKHHRNRLLIPINET